MADKVADLLGERADLAGHSMGGRVAVLLAQRLPGRVRRLIDPIMSELRTPDPARWGRLAAITAPTLLVSGGPASHVTRESLERMCGLIPDCCLVTIEDAGHRVHSTKPAEFAAVAGSSSVRRNLATWLGRSGGGVHLCGVFR